MKFLLDTNILIYLMNQRDEVIDYLNDLCADAFAMSSISYMEVFVGIKPSQKRKAKNFLAEVEVIPFDKGCAEKASEWHQQSNKRLKFKDLMIASTAQKHNLPLVTADSDFKSIKDLQIKYVKISL